VNRRKRAVFNWSGGKDSALALYKVLQGQEYEVVSLLTTVNQDSSRSSMHGIPVSLLQKQADSIGIPLHLVSLAPGGEMAGYEQAMQQAVDHFKAQGVVHFIFGDIFLHDVKSYREQKLRPHGITVVEPLWGKTSAEIMTEFLASGLQTIVVTTTADILDQRYIGRLIDKDFIQDLPPGVDVCGENGEYHTFCYAGGMFRNPVPFALGGPFQKSFPIKLSDGSTQNYAYWFANLQDTDTSTS
jgi:uncharacterized protein (TIGR00290 family)